MSSLYQILFSKSASERASMTKNCEYFPKKAHTHVNNQAWFHAMILEAHEHGEIKEEEFAEIWTELGLDLKKLDSKQKREHQRSLAVFLAPRYWAVSNTKKLYQAAEQLKNKMRKESDIYGRNIPTAVVLFDRTQKYRRGLKKSGEDYGTAPLQLYDELQVTSVAPAPAPEPAPDNATDPDDSSIELPSHGSSEEVVPVKAKGRRAMRDDYFRKRKFGEFNNETTSSGVEKRDAAHSKSAKADKEKGEERQSSEGEEEMEEEGEDKDETESEDDERGSKYEEKSDTGEEESGDEDGATGQVDELEPDTEDEMAAMTKRHPKKAARILKQWESGKYHRKTGDDRCANCKTRSWWCLVKKEGSQFWSKCESCGQNRCSFTDLKVVYNRPVKEEHVGDGPKEIGAKKAKVISLSMEQVKKVHEAGTLAGVYADSAEEDGNKQTAKKFRRIADLINQVDI